MLQMKIAKWKRKGSKQRKRKGNKQRKGNKERKNYNLPRKASK